MNFRKDIPMINRRKASISASRRSMALLGPTLAFTFVICGCAGKSDVSPVDVEKQAFEDLRAEIRSAIDDPDRETKVIAMVDEMGEELASLRRLKKQRQTQVKKLNANYDTTRAEFDAFIIESNADIRQKQQRILEKRVAFIEITTPEEWAKISDARTEAISAAFKTAQSI